MLYRHIFNTFHTIISYLMVCRVIDHGKRCQSETSLTKVVIMGSVAGQPTQKTLVIIQHHEPVATSLIVILKVLRI